MPFRASEPTEARVDAYRERLVQLGDIDRGDVAAKVREWLVSDGVRPESLDGALDATVDELVGYGPIDAMLSDPRVTEVMVNGCRNIWVEMDGRLRETRERFRDRDQLLVVIERLLLGTGRRVDEGSPMVDARLVDGSRLNAVLSPIAVDGPFLTIRRVAQAQLGFGDLLRAQSMNPQMAAFIHAAVCGKANILVSGAAGSGKTTLLAAIAGLVPSTQRIVCLEDVHELRIRHPHVINHECRPGGVEGAQAVEIRDLVRNSLRMRPDRLIIGEVRSMEAADMVQAMNTGHSGSMTTLHANTSSDAIQRLEAMLALAWPAIGAEVLQRWMVSALDLIIQCERTSDGLRRISSIAAVEHTADGAGVSIRPLFSAQGDCFVSSGEIPRRCLRRMEDHGVQFPTHLFEAAA